MVGVHDKVIEIVRSPEHRNRDVVVIVVRIFQIYVPTVTGDPEEKEEVVNVRSSDLQPAIEFAEGVSSVFDACCMDCPAQYAGEEGTPQRKWERVRTKLSLVAGWISLLRLRLIWSLSPFSL